MKRSTALGRCHRHPEGGANITAEIGTAQALMLAIDPLLTIVLVALMAH
jgi:hypothetical protein